jgi:hypothetical protein
MVTAAKKLFDLMRYLWKVLEFYFKKIEKSNPS